MSENGHTPQPIRTCKVSVVLDLDTGQIGVVYPPDNAAMALGLLEAARYTITQHAAGKTAIREAHVQPATHIPFLKGR